MLLTNSYQFIVRSIGNMTAPNGANYFILLYAKAVPVYDTGYNFVYVRPMIACTENSSFYGYETSTKVEVNWSGIGAFKNKPDAAWDDEPITVHGVTYKKHTWLPEASCSIDCSNGKDKEITVSVSFSFLETTTDSYAPSGGVALATEKVQLSGIHPSCEVDSISSATKYLDSTITCKYTINNSSYYVRRHVYLNIDGNLTTIRAADLGKKTVGSQTSEINLSDAELSQIYAKVKNATSVKLRVSLRTYSDAAYANSVGETAYKEINLTIPTSVKPSVSISVNSLSPISWIASQKIYVTGGIANAKFTITGEAGEGASLSYTSITMPDGSTKNGTTFTFDFTNSGTYTFIATAADSRGRIDTAPVEIKVLSYGAPTISLLQAERGTYTSEWNASDNGADVRVKFNTKLHLADNGNTYSAAFNVDGTAATPVTGSTANLTSGTEQTVYFRNIDAEKSHRLALTVTDRVGSTTAAAITVPTSNVTIEYNESGKGVAFGKPSEKKALECAWPAYLYDDLFLATKISCLNPFSLRNFNINCYWADNAAHDMIVRNNDGLTLGLGWTGNADDGTSYETVLDVRPKQANFRGTITAPRGRFTATNDSSGTERNDVALRVGDADGQHIDMDTNEIQAKEDPATPGPLHLNLDGGDVYANGFRIPEIQRGSVTITPSAANAPTSADVTFPKAFSGTPTVIVTPATAVPGTTVVGAGVNSVNSTGCKIWVTRINTTNTIVNWIAVY